MKSWFFIAIVSLISVSIGIVRADWPQYLGPDRNGISSETGLAKSWPKDGPKVLWTKPLGEGFAAAAIKDGQVYLLDRVKSQEDVLRCYDLATGNELWSFSHKDSGEFDFNGSRNPPTVDEKNVYCVGPMGTVYCISRSTHEAVWMKDFKTDYNAERPMWGFSQSPLLYKNLVIVAPQCPKAGAVAYDKNSGKAVWQTPKLCDRVGYSSPVLTTIDGVDQAVLMTPLRAAPDEEEQEEQEKEPTFEGGGLYGIDAKKGEILWNYKGIACNITIPPITLIGDGRMFVTAGYEAGSAMIKVVRKLGKFQVHELFKTDEYDAQIHPALFYKDHLYLNGNSNERRNGLMCLSLEGKVLWKTRRKPSFGRGGLILADGMIYIVEGDKGHLYLVKATPKEYTEVGMVKDVLKGEEIWAPLALADGKLVIRDQQQLKCLEVKEALAAKE